MMLDASSGMKASQMGTNNWDVLAVFGSVNGMRRVRTGCRCGRPSKSWLLLAALDDDDDCCIRHGK